MRATFDIVAETDGRCVGSARPHRKKRFGWQFKARAGTHLANHGEYASWRAGWVWYETAQRRDVGIATLARKERLWEYRPVER